MTGTAVGFASPDQLEDRICAEAIRRTALIDPFLSVVMALAVESDSDEEQANLAHVLTPHDGQLGLKVLRTVIDEFSREHTGGHA